MNYLSKHGVVRLLVNVLDANKIPDDTDIVVKGYMYPIYFKVDEIVSTDEEDFDDDDLLDEDFGMGEDHEMTDAEPPKDKPAEDSGENNNLEKIQEANQSTMALAQQLKLVEEAIDMAVDRLLDELSLKVALEDVSDNNQDESPISDEIGPSPKQMDTAAANGGEQTTGPCTPGTATVPCRNSRGL